MDRALPLPHAVASPEPPPALKPSSRQLPCLAAKPRVLPGSGGQSELPVLSLKSFLNSHPGLQCDTAICSTFAAFLGVIGPHRVVRLDC